ncbi:MAG: ThiF family adenylyltransferase [Candidatus Obscuribacterales bacterium]|nr:ThiF family adenylyltransferase [Candidatus Obscuribacterales bacterium]
MLNDEQLERYQKQMALPGMSQKKQEELLSSTCLVLTGAHCAILALEQLVVSGVGSIRVLNDVAAGGDDQRHSLANRGIANPDVSIDFVRFENGNDFLELLVADTDSVLEASLDWQLKLKLSDVCMAAGVPLVHSGCDGGFRQQVYTMVPGKSACLRCALPLAGIDDYPLIPVSGNAFLPVDAWAASLMALETIKILARLGVTQANELWKLDGLIGEAQTIHGLDPRRDCPDCGSRTA